MAKIVLRNVIIGFPRLFTPERFNEQSQPAYSLKVFIEEGSEADTQIRDAIKAAATATWKGKAELRLKKYSGDPKAFCYQSGETTEYEKPYGDACYILTARRPVPQGASTGNAPVVVDRRKNPITANDGLIYSGCICNVVVDIWAQESDKGSGVRCMLVSVQFVKDGKSYGAAPATADDLDDLGDDPDAVGTNHGDDDPF